MIENDKPINTEHPLWLSEAGGKFFDVIHDDERRLLVLKGEIYPSTNQMMALYNVGDAKLLAGRETELHQRQAYELHDSHVPLNSLTPEVSQNWEEEINTVLGRVHEMSGIPTGLLTPYLTHGNFPLKGVNPIKILPSFIDAFNTARDLGAQSLKG